MTTKEVTRTHTPLPWGQINIAASSGIGVVPINKNGKPRDGRSTEDICVISKYQDYDAEANAEFILRAVNTHDDLVAVAAKLVLAADQKLLSEKHRVVEMARAALAKAGVTA